MSSIPCPQRPPVLKNQETNSMVKKSLVVKKPVPSASRSIKIESKMQVAEVAEDVVASPEESREEFWSSPNPNTPLRSDSLEESEDQEAEEAEEAEEGEEADGEVLTQSEEEEEEEENYAVIRVKRITYWHETNSNRVYKYISEDEVGDLVGKYNLLNGIPTISPA